MGNARARGDYAERKRQSLERPRAVEPEPSQAPRVPMALYQHVTITRKDGTKENVIERHKDGEKIVAADGRARYVMNRRGLRRVN